MNFMNFLQQKEDIAKYPEQADSLNSGCPGLNINGMQTTVDINIKIDQSNNTHAPVNFDAIAAMF